MNKITPFCFFLLNITQEFFSSYHHCSTIFCLVTHYIMSKYFSHMLFPCQIMSCCCCFSYCFFKELETGVVDLLIPSPNATAEVGYNRDR